MHRCVGCNAGKFKEKWGTAGCIDCSSPKYSPNGSYVCTNCPSGKMWTRMGGEDTACAICEAGKYAYAVGSVDCANCPAGSYQPLNESATCVSCVSGKAGMVTNATSEMVGCHIHCTPGKYSAANAYWASSNPASYSSYYSSTSPYTYPTACTQCEANKFSDTHLAGPTCTACPSFSYSPIGSNNRTNCTCGAGYTGDDGEPCTACSAGQFKSISGSMPCLICSAGEYQPYSARTACYLCPIGSFQPRNESASCHSCPAGKAGTVTNATSESSGCPLHCTPGHYSTTPYPTACRDCVSNTYSDVHLAGSCSSCPAYSSSPSTSILVTNCTCNAGYTGPDGGTCAACTTGQFKSASGPANCTDCAAGKYSASVAAVSESTCSGCGAATYSAAGAAACETCPAYSISSLESGSASDCTSVIVFTSADTDGSGSISAAELASFNTVYSFSGGLSAADFDGDGILSAAEFYAHTCVGPGCQVIFCLVTSFNVAVLGR